MWLAEGDDAADLRLLYANAEASRHANIDLTQLVGKRVGEVFPNALAAPGSYNLPAMWQRAAVSDQREVMPAIWQRQGSGPARWLNAYAIPLGDRQVAAVHEDISARMQAEHEIRKLNLELQRSLDVGERRYHAIFDSAPVALCQTDLGRLREWLDGLRAQHGELVPLLRQRPELVAQAAARWPLLEANETALRVMGAHRQGDLPESFGEIVRGASTSVWQELLVALAEGATRFEAELALEGFAGVKTFLLHMLIPSERADLANVVVSMLDITERKRLERELWAAQRMESIGHLTGGVAHDFNNLLMVIGSYAGFLLDGLEEGHPGREDVKVIQDACERAARLTNQLLAFSRRQVQRLEVLNLNETVTELEKMLRRVISEQIQLNTRYERPLGLVKADRSQIEQVLMNLAVNARDAVAEGGTLTIETANAEVEMRIPQPEGEDILPGSYVLLTIRDDGCGMDEATRVRAFEPFFTTKEVGRGTGLGLSTVYGIVKQSQGHIALYSEPGRGTRFEIYLPRIDEETATPNKPETMRPAAEVREVVLLVEDEERVRIATRRILEKGGYRVLDASDGVQALELAEHFEAAIDVLLTDVVMPQMSGPELALRLATLRPQIKVVYVSGYADNAILQQAALRADTAYVHKPFSPDALLNAVREILDRGPAGDER